METSTSSSEGYWDGVDDVSDTLDLYLGHSSHQLLDSVHGRDKAAVMKRGVRGRKKPTRQGLRDSLLKSLDESELNDLFSEANGRVSSEDEISLNGSLRSQSEERLTPQKSYTKNADEQQKMLFVNNLADAMKGRQSRLQGSSHVSDGSSFVSGSSKPNPVRSQRIDKSYLTPVDEDSDEKKKNHLSTNDFPSHGVNQLRSSKQKLNGDGNSLTSSFERDVDIPTIHSPGLQDDGLADGQHWYNQLEKSGRKKRPSNGKQPLPELLPNKLKMREIASTESQQASHFYGEKDEPISDRCDREAVSPLTKLDTSSDDVLGNPWRTKLRKTQPNTVRPQFISNEEDNDQPPQWKPKLRRVDRREAPTSEAFSSNTKASVTGMSVLPEINTKASSTTSQSNEDVVKPVTSKPNSSLSPPANLPPLKSNEVTLPLLDQQSVSLSSLPQKSVRAPLATIQSKNDAPASVSNSRQTGVEFRAQPDWIKRAAEKSKRASLLLEQHEDRKNSESKEVEPAVIMRQKNNRSEVNSNNRATNDISPEDTQVPSWKKELNKRNSRRLQNRYEKVDSLVEKSREQTPDSSHSGDTPLWKKELRRLSTRSSIISTKEEEATPSDTEPEFITIFKKRQERLKKSDMKESEC